MAAIKRRGGEVCVNAPDEGYQSVGAVTALTGGRVLMTWIDDAGTGEYSRDLRGRIYASDGTALGDEFVVSKAPYEQIEVHAAALADGGFIATWRTQTAPPPEGRAFDVVAQRYDANGARVGKQIAVHNETGGGQGNPHVAVLADSTYVITWDDFGGTDGDGSGSSVRAQRFRPDGRRFGDDFVVNTTAAGDQQHSVVTALAGGGYAVAWDSAAGSTSGANATATVFVQIFSARGVRIGGEIAVSSGVPLALSPAIATLTDGTIAVAFSSYSFTLGTSEIYVRHLAATGAPLGPVQQVNSVPEELQIGAEITALDNGGYLVGWTDFSRTYGDESTLSVKAQAFFADDTRNGDTILVNKTTDREQGNPAMARLDDGRVVIGWTNEAAPVNGMVDGDVRAQFYDFAPPPQRYTGDDTANVFTAPTAADWRIEGLAGADRLTGGTGYDTILGGTGADILAGGDGDDRFVIGFDDGFDAFDGGAGMDVIRADADGATIGISAIAGIERIDASGFVGVTIRGDASANILDFSTVELLGIAVIAGGAGADTITGSSRDDVIQGGAGADILASGTGFDRFTGTMASHRGDTILDFRPQDRLFISDFDAEPGQATFTFRGDKAIFDPDGAGTRAATFVHLVGFDPGQGYSVSLDASGGLTFGVF